MNAREVIAEAVEAYFSDTLDGGNIADVVLERMEAAGFTIMSKEDVEAVRDKALEEAAKAVERTYGINAATIRSLKSIPRKE